MKTTASASTDSCPECSGAGRVVTAVTVKTLGVDPRTVLVTRLCSTANCHMKYTTFKDERQLSEEERLHWHQR